MKKFLVMVALLVTYSLCSGQYSGKIIKVYDGETIWVELQNGDIDSIKLWGIDAPELDQTYGEAAKQHLSKQIHREVEIKYKNRDRQNYMQAIVTYANKKEETIILNNELIENGYAWKSKYTDDKTLEKLQKSAMKNKMGLWRKNDPTPPWEWRESHN